MLKDCNLPFFLHLTRFSVCKSIFFPFLILFSRFFFLKFVKAKWIGKWETKWKKSWILGLRRKRIIINVLFRFFWVVCDEIKPWHQPKRHNNARIKMYNNTLAQLVSVNLNMVFDHWPLFSGELILETFFHTLYRFNTKLSGCLEKIKLHPIMICTIVVEKDWTHVIHC